MNFKDYINENKAVIGDVSKNIVGTISMDMKIKGMKKMQSFIFYASGGESETKIQSSTRIGLLNLETGDGKMSKPHQSGAYFHHLSLDKLTDFKISSSDLKKIKTEFNKTQGSKSKVVSLFGKK